MAKRPTSKKGIGGNGKRSANGAVVRASSTGKLIVHREANRSGKTEAIAKYAAKGGATLRVGTVRKALGISQEELARVTGYSTRSIAGWEAGKIISDSARQKLAETERLRAGLAQIIGPDHLGEWMRTPNAAFEGQTPIQIIERGESDRLWRMIFEINVGVAN